jgi:hypothetical protein
MCQPITHRAGQYHCRYVPTTASRQLYSTVALLPSNTSKSRSLHRDKYNRKVSRLPAVICSPVCRLSRSTLKCPASRTPPPASVVVKVFLALTGCGLSFAWLTQSSRFGTLYIQLFPPQSRRAPQVYRRPHPNPWQQTTKTKT